MMGSGVMPFSKQRPPATADKLAAARLLAERGPIYGKDAVTALGWTTERWWDVVGKCKEWFSLTSIGWVLSEDGRQAAEQYAAEGSPQ
jgi:hypothetical protein